MTQPVSIQQAIEFAREHQRAGRLPEAEAMAREILAAHPDQPDALHLLGAIACQVGRADVAIELLRRSMSLQTASTELLNNLGSALMLVRRFDEAINAFRQAIAKEPHTATFHYNLGNALRDRGLIDQAITSFRQALVHRPAYPNALNNVGTLLMETGRLDEAITALRQAISLSPQMPAAHYNLARALFDVGQVDQAISTLEHLLTFTPNYADAYNNLGVIFEKIGQYDRARATLNQAISLRPDWPEAHYNLGNVHRAVGEYQQAIAEYERTLALRADHSLANYNLGLTQLLLGNLREGWAGYEWRWSAPDFPLQPRFPWPRWKSEPLSGKRLLLHIEQGFGDMIQFVRYTPLLTQAGAKVIFTCPPVLGRLLSTLPGIEKVVTTEREIPSNIDMHCPLLSVPGLLGTTLETIPASIPYLHADATRSETWRERLSKLPGKKVGIAWAGRPENRSDKRRSIPLKMLAPLGQVSNISFISLQKGRGSEEVAAESGLSLHDWTTELTDFADTAALIDNLDLVITVDTAVAHLAGAMGKPVWLLITFVPDWRWLLDRTDSPWYPTIRLFRQPALNDWSSPIHEIAIALQSFRTE